MPALVDAVEEAMDAAGWDTAHLVGNSMGGWIAAELAARGRARTVVATSPAGLYTAKELRYSRARRCARRSRRRSGSRRTPSASPPPPRDAGWRSG